ncbi:MAG: S1C family serine protease [Pseudonocardiaceae bacterium]
MAALFPLALVALALALVVWAGHLWQEFDAVPGTASGSAVGGADANPGSGNAAGPGALGAPNGAPAASGNASDIASRVSQGLVDITTTLGYANGQAAGTGIVLTSAGEVLTNNHVIEGATDIAVTDVGNGRSYPATVVGYDRTHDIAVLQLQGASGLPTPVLGDSSGTAVGDAVTAIGNAGGVGGAPSVAPGTITALNRSVTATDDVDSTSEQLTHLIQINADIQAGDSGGALVNSAGKIIGIDTAASTGFQVQQSGGQGFAIPINQARAIVHQIETGAGSASVHIGPTPILGIQVQDVGIENGHRRNRSFSQGSSFTSSGALIRGVVAGSPAEQAGLSAGDVITSLDGQAVDSTSTLSALLGLHHPGDQVELGWFDSYGQQQTATVQLVRGPAA